MGIILSFISQMAISQATVPGSMSINQKRRAMQMTSYFENSTIIYQYDYIENIQDGRGYTVGRIGFTSRTGDLKDLMHLYCDNEKASDPICGFRKTLDKLALNNSGDTSELGIPFVKAWKDSANTLSMQKAQDQAVENWYFRPAESLAENFCIDSALGKAIIYDTGIQHGIPGLLVLLQRTNKQIKSCSGSSESDWLIKFLSVRRAELLNPEDHASQEAWSQSVGRVDFLLSEIKARNFDLHGPVEMDPESSSSESLIP